MVEYRMKTELHHSRSLGWYIAFGIGAYRRNRLMLYIPDVFCRRKDAKSFIDKCNRLHLDILHLKDTIEDAL